jgi:hypothetical protein
VRAVDRTLYLIFAGVTTLAVARAFYGSMLLQTRGEWSAPLDDVFIHFDYARAAARGYPFEWSPGNGYSSGNTSILYPFVLAAGYGVGFRGSALAIWAGIIACVSAFVVLVVAARLFAPLSRFAKFLAIPALFVIGALDWSLFSGMEVALFLGVWAMALRSALISLEPGEAADASTATRVERVVAAVRPFELGIWGAVLVLTRPEGATSLAALGIMCAQAAYARKGAREACLILARAAAPAVLVLALQAIANRLLTGEFAASGAIVKLTLYNPYMTAAEKLAEYRFLLEYVVFRNTEYHFSDVQPYGYIVPALAAVPLFPRSTRRVAVTLWASIVTWLAIVALNAQVRWQNERYTMPAVAWTLLLAALGVGILVDPRGPLAARDRWDRGLFAARASLTSLLVILFLRHEEPRMRDQIWFFGRACRNIRDQHVTAGRILRQMSPSPRRVLVGDAGALIYASDLPGLDLIGLGGYHDLPFARAGVHGLGATLELIERIPARDRPDWLAIYPSWWGDLPTWFGKRVTGVPVLGNVICGGAEKVLYRADWRGLGEGAKPLGPDAGERIIDEVDVADLVSERQHDYRFPRPSAGFVEARLLPGPTHPQIDVFDAGRRIPPERAEEFRMQLTGHPRTRLVARTVPEHDVEVDVSMNGKPVGALRFGKADGWREAAVDLPETSGSVEITLTARREDWVDHHVWAVDRP